MLQVQEVSKYFFERPALDCVSADFPAGVSGIAGRNGSGKTVFLKMLAGVYPADSGAIILHNQPLRFLSPSQSIRAGIAYVSQLGSISLGLSAGEFQTLTGEDIGLPRKQRFSSLSPSDRQRIELRLALAHRPKVLLLDEPILLSGADSESVWREIEEYIASSGCIVLATLHDLEQLAKRCRQIFLIVDHRIQPFGPLDENVCARVERLRGHLGFRDSANDDHAPNRGVSRFLGLHGQTFEVKTPGLSCILVDYSATWIDVIEEFQASVKRSFWSENVAWVPGHLDDRSLALSCTIQQNLSIALRHSQLYVDVESLLDAFQIQPAKPSDFARNLSGGNRQRLALARAFSLGRRVMAVVSPLRGLDRSGVALILHQFRQFVDGGGTVLVLTNEDTEAAVFGDRMAGHL